MKKGFWITFSLLLLSLVVFGVFHFYGLSRVAQAGPVGNGKEPERGVPPVATIGEVRKEKPLPVVTVQTVMTANLSKTMELTGSVTPTRTARMASPGEGPVEVCAVRNCMVREGDLVKKGQVLLQIGRNSAAEAQLAAARQALKEQEMELQRVEQLVQGGAIAGSQLDTARSKYENARAQLAKAMESNEDYSVKAPWDGTVFKVHVAEGDYVAPRTPLIEIFDRASMVVQFAIPEAESTQVREEMPVQVRFDAHPGKTFKGKIVRVYPQLDERMRTRSVEAAMIDPVSLIPGMFSRIQVFLAQISDAVIVPAEAVRVTPDGERAVFVIQDDKAQRRKVQTGIEEAGRVQIVSGIHPGERVIVAGNENLKDGAQIQARGSEKS
jgi:RND family efflux transporter MFP subunit